MEVFTGVVGEGFSWIKSLNFYLGTILGEFLEMF
jgi:hypothetical protein